MLKWIAVAASFCLSACMVSPQSAPVPAATDSVEIGRGARLMLPAPPGFPDTIHLSQLITATYDGTPLRVQSELDLGPDAVVAALSPLGGPPVMTIRWTGAGIEIDKSEALPPALDGRRILADIMLAYWPPAVVSAQLSAGTAFSATETQRRVTHNGATMIEIQTVQSDHRETVTIINSAQNYELTIISKRPKP